MNKAIVSGLALIALAALLNLGEYDPLIGWLGLTFVVLGTVWQLAYASAQFDRILREELGNEQVD